MKTETEVRAALDDLHAAITSAERDVPGAARFLPSMTTTRAAFAWVLGVESSHADAVGQLIDRVRSILASEGMAG